jgi:hypothetical protein
MNKLVLAYENDWKRIFESVSEIIKLLVAENFIEKFKSILETFEFPYRKEFSSIDLTLQSNQFYINCFGYCINISVNSAGKIDARIDDSFMDFIVRNETRSNEMLELILNNIELDTKALIVLAKLKD